MSESASAAALPDATSLRGRCHGFNRAEKTCTAETLSTQKFKRRAIPVRSYLRRKLLNSNDTAVSMSFFLDSGSEGE
jgi:hypothetical protein